VPDIGGPRVYAFADLIRGYLKARCGKVLRLRPALSAEQRAQARALRWAAAQIEMSLTTTHRRKPRGGIDEAVDAALVRVADQLLSWSRLIH
jgi:hypothetical protein